MKKLALLAFFTFAIEATPVKIFTFAYNRPEFIEWQYYTFKKFMLDDYTFTVYNDAKDVNLEHQIIQMCNKLEIECIRIPQEIHSRPYLKREPGENYQNPSIRASNVIQYSLDTNGFNYDGIVMIIDSDMFLIEPFSVKKYMEEYDISAVPQSPNGINYLWIGLLFMDMTTLPNRRTLNWNCGTINGHRVDTGGFSHLYLKDNPQIRVRYQDGIHTLYTLCPNCFKPDLYGGNYSCTHNREALERSNFKEETIRFLHTGPENIEFFCGNNFLHYRSATWDLRTADYHHRKTKMIRGFLESKIGRSLH